MDFRLLAVDLLNGMAMDLPGGSIWLALVCVALPGSVWLYLNSPYSAWFYLFCLLPGSLALWVCVLAIGVALDDFIWFCEPWLYPSLPNFAFAVT
jgi:hypothetical protein